MEFDMNEKIIRLNLRVSDGLHPILFHWLDRVSPKLRCAKLSQYLEMNMIADENGGVLRRADLPMATTLHTSAAIPLTNAVTPEIGSQRAQEKSAAAAAEALGDKWG
jgi:hypothetical protein